MIDHDNRIIYIDHSTMSTFQACHEKSRLSPYRLPTPEPALSFGHAMHAARAAFYDARAGFVRDESDTLHYVGYADNPIKMAQVAFLRDLKATGGMLPITIETDEPRSVERGLALVDAYLTRWQDERYEVILDADGKPLSEIGFQFHLMDYMGWEVRYVGYIDAIMRNVMTRRPVIFETKTTTQSLKVYVKARKPNHQITGYFRALPTILPEEKVYDCVWDCIFISSRQPNMKKALQDRYAMYGISLEDDFARQVTQRSDTDVEEFLWDARETTKNYINWLLSGATRWPRNTGNCHNYGGCRYREVCSLNGNEDYLQSNFVIERWEPWKKIVERSRKVVNVN